MLFLGAVCLQWPVKGIMRVGGIKVGSLPPLGDYFEESSSL